MWTSTSTSSSQTPYCSGSSSLLVTWMTRTMFCPFHASTIAWCLVIPDRAWVGQEMCSPQCRSLADWMTTWLLLLMLKPTAIATNSASKHQRCDENANRDRWFETKAGYAQWLKWFCEARGAHLPKPGWSTPHTHSNPTNLALFRRKISLYRFNQGAHTIAGGSNGSRGLSPPHFNHWIC